MRSLALRAALLGCLSAVGIGCASSPNAESGDAAAQLDSARGSEAEEPPKSPTDLSPDPYRKVPQGSGRGTPRDTRSPAAFTPPSSPSPTPEPGARDLQRPSTLRVTFVHRGRFKASPRGLLTLESQLAEAPGLREVTALSLPRGPARSLETLGREAHAEGAGLLLVVVLPSPGELGHAYLLHCQEPTAPALLLARYRAPTPRDPPPPQDAAFTSDEPDSIAGLIARIAVAHRALHTP